MLVNWQMKITAKEFELGNIKHVEGDVDSLTGWFRVVLNNGDNHYFEMKAIEIVCENCKTSVSMDQWNYNHKYCANCFVAEVRDACNRNYSAGGDLIMECFDDSEILSEFESMDDVKSWIGLRLELASNARQGLDTDPELVRLARFKEWK